MMARIEPVALRETDEAEVIELVAHTTLYIGFGRFNEIVGLEAT
jgi:hypothetical protein